MPEALAAAGENPFKQQMDLILRFVESQAKDGKHLVSERAIRGFMIQEVDPMRSQMLLDELVAAGLLHATGEAPKRFFKVREQHTSKTQSNTQEPDDAS